MKLQRAEVRFLIWLITAVVLVTSAPYVFGWLATPAHRTYTGIHRLTPGDISVYYSFIEQGRQGQVFSRNLFSSEAQPVAAVLTPQWYAVGQFAKLFHVSNIVAYQLTRVGFSILFLILAYHFIAGMLPAHRVRMVAMTVLSFGTGFGAFVPIGDIAHAVRTLAIPIDLWVPEAFPFLSLYHNPLFLMGLCGILAVFMLVERAYDQQDTVAAWFASGLLLILAIIHPYDVFLIAAVLAGHFFVRVLGDRTWSVQRARSYLRLLVLVLLPAVLALGTLRTIFAIQPGLAGWAAQNVTLSPAVWWYLPAYLIPCVLAFMAFPRALRTGTTRTFVVVTWAGVVPLLLYLPYFPYQRRMMEGWFIALVVLGAVAVQAFWQRARKRGALVEGAVIATGITLVIILMGITSLTHLVKDAYYAAFGREPVSMPTGVVQAFQWVRDTSDVEAVVLARPNDSNLLPGWAGRTVFLGHADLTAKSKAKTVSVQAFFTPNAAIDRLAFLRESRITHVVIRQDDVAAFAMLQTFSLPLRVAYKNTDALVYVVAGSGQ
ncbi:MAG: hypothetical protein AAB515_02130 [Patescibacteria group bacterium]